jgi:hypothetical protein
MKKNVKKKETKKQKEKKRKVITTVASWLCLVMRVGERAFC